MPHAVVYYHIIWATKYRQELISPQIETVIIDVIGRKSAELKCKIHAINTVPDHIHVAVSIRLSLSVAEWTRQIKSLSSKIIRQEFTNMETEFRWQTSYSVHTFGKKTLPFVVAYIENQKIHHQTGETEPYLEYIPDE